jgi:hypothetical protein
VFYGFKNPAVAGLEKPAGLPFPFAGSMLYNLTKFAVPAPDPLQSYLGAARLTPPSSTPAVAGIWGHTQNFGATTVTRDFMPKGELCGGCHVVIAPEIPVEYPKIRNSYQIQADGKIAPPYYPGTTNKPCPRSSRCRTGCSIPRSIRACSSRSNRRPTSNGRRRPASAAPRRRPPARSATCRTPKGR